MSEIDQRVIGEAEADLQRLLAVEPSPEFAAKVRMRVGVERREPKQSRAAWRFAFAAASIAIVGIIVVLVTPRRTQDDVPPPAPVVARTQPAAAPPVRPFDATERRPEAIAGRGASREPRSVQEPEVFVPADQQMAIARLLAMARAGTLDQHAFPAAVQTPAEGDTAPPVPPMVVEELKVPLITVDGVDSEKGN